MARFLVRCANEKCKSIYYINDPDFPPDLDRKSFLNNLRDRLGLSDGAADGNGLIEKTGSPSDQKSRMIAYIFGCYKCGMQNAVDLELANA